MSKLVRRALYPAVSRLCAHATLVEGRLKGTETPFRCLFVDNSRFGEYLTGRMYDTLPDRLEKKRIWIPALRRRLLSRRDGHDLCVAVLPRFYEALFRGLYDYRTTETVRQVIDTSGSWDDVKSRFSKKKRQVANNFEAKSGLGYRLSHEPGDLEFFYHRMFVPHITRRYGELATIDSYVEMQRFFRRGVLLFVTKGGQAVAGALSLVEDGVLRFRRTGVLDGDESHVDGGAQTALYYFQLRYAQEHGLRAVDTMMSAPFLNDGVYRHKREWGAVVLPDDETRTWVYVFGATPSEKTARFFEDNPMVVHRDDGMKGMIGISGDAAPSPAAINERVRRYEATGLRGFLVVTRAEVLAAPQTRPGTH
ncbi:MAG: hypothetical protein AB1806_16100 [Acidobacteriota bacterium]